MWNQYFKYLKATRRRFELAKAYSKYNSVISVLHQELTFSSAISIMPNEASLWSDAASWEHGTLGNVVHARGNKRFICIDISSPLSTRYSFNSDKPTIVAFFCKVVEMLHITHSKQLGSALRQSNARERDAAKQIIGTF